MNQSNESQNEQPEQPNLLDQLFSLALLIGDFKMAYELSDEARKIMETEMNYAQQTEQASPNHSEKLNRLFGEVMNVRGEVGTVSAPDELKLIERFTEELINSMYTFIDRMQILDQERRLKMLREEMNERQKIIDHKSALIEKRQNRPTIGYGGGGGGQPGPGADRCGDPFA